jgi:hypothetical protein
MGCWNYTSQTKRGSAARDAVLAMIKTHPRQELLVVAGDNAYPDKVKMGKEKIKTFNVAEISAGFAALKDARDPGQLLVGIGNHNAEKLNAGGKPILQVERETFGSCFKNLYFCRMFSKDHTALVFIDTNAFEKKFKTLNALYEDPEYVSQMLEWLEETILYLRSKRYKYYLIQHEPFFSVKPKGLHVLSQASALLDVLLSYRPIAVLSADTHNHQQWKLTYKGASFMQVVTGTGGAKPDYVPALETMPLNETRAPVAPFSSIQYKTPMANRTPSYGYLEIVEPHTYNFMAVATRGANFRTDRGDDEAPGV